MEDKREIRVLLVEDNAAYAQLVKLYLQKSKNVAFALTWARNGREALSELEQEVTFDVVLLDYFLPRDNGLACSEGVERKER